MTTTEESEPVFVAFPDAQAIQGFGSKTPFLNLALAISSDVVDCVGLAHRARKDASRSDEYKACEPAGRDEAILRGHLARLIKLVRTMDSEIELKRGDWLALYGRLITETSVNLQCLVKNGEFDDYVLHSLRSEMSLLDQISGRIADEERDEAPIEARMRSSVRRSLKAGSVSEEQARNRSGAPLFGKNFFQRIDFLNIERPRISYIGSYALPSHSIHGSWEDLYRNHLYENDGGLMPDSHWTEPEPAYLLVPLLIVLDAVEAFMTTMSFSGSFQRGLEELVATNRERLNSLLDGLEVFKARSGSDDATISEV